MAQLITSRGISQKNSSLLFVQILLRLSLRKPIKKPQKPLGRNLLVKSSESPLSLGAGASHQSEQGELPGVEGDNWGANSWVLALKRRRFILEKRNICREPREVTWHGLEQNKCDELRRAIIYHFKIRMLSRIWSHLVSLLLSPGLPETNLLKDNIDKKNPEFVSTRYLFLEPK